MRRLIHSFTYSLIYSITQLRFYTDRTDGGDFGGFDVCAFGPDASFRIAQKEYIQGPGAGACLDHTNGRRRRSPER